MPTVIVGASQLKYLDRYVQSDDCFVRYRSGARLEEFFDLMSDVVRDCSVIVIHGGTNNMPLDTPELFLRKYQALVRRIQRSRPDARIVISGILPRSTNLFPDMKQRPGFIDKCNRRAMTVNATLSAICGRIANLNYVSHPMFSNDGKVDRGLISRDGLHLQPAGIVQLKRDIWEGMRRARRTPVPVPLRSPPMAVPDTPYKDALLEVQTEEDEVPEEDIPPELGMGGISL